MTAELARAGGPLGCAGLALLLVAGDRRLRLGGLAAWALGLLFLALYLAPHGHRPKLAAAAAAGLVVAAAGAVLLRRFPWLLAFAALACAPVRFSVAVGDTQARLLVPLYLVLGAAVLALAWELLRGAGVERARELGPIALPLAAFLAWSGLSLAWSDDLSQGSIDLLFFYLPFGILALCVARLPWRELPVRVLHAQLLAMGVGFAALGIYQWVAKDVFWNRKLIVGNAYSSLFRVNGVFYDPSIYGRFLDYAILAALVLLLRRPARRLAALLVATIAVAWAGLLFSFSQSSFIALAAATVAAAALAWRFRARAAVVLAAGVLLAGAVAPVAGAADATGGRGKLVRNGLAIGAHHPVGGVGLGGFKRAYASRVGLRGKEPRSAASHTTPVTVFAETGVPGLVLFCWLALAALLTPLRRPRPGVAGAACAVAGVALIAVGVHSLGYNALFEDPIFWGLLGLAALAARADAEPAAAGAPA